MADFITCFKCGIVFGVPEHWLKCRREDKESFFCPNGHSQAFVKSEADKLRLERDRLAQRIAEKDDELKELETRRRAAVGQVTKLRKRAASGTCPCCKRTFSNMAEHMKHQHPEFVNETGAKVVPIKRVAR